MPWLLCSPIPLGASAPCSVGEVARWTSRAPVHQACRIGVSRLLPPPLTLLPSPFYREGGSQDTESQNMSLTPFRAGSETLTYLVFILQMWKQTSKIKKLGQGQPAKKWWQNCGTTIWPRLFLWAPWHFKAMLACSVPPSPLCGSGSNISGKGYLEQKQEYSLRQTVFWA